jgi:hypothetical protein
MSEAKMEDRRIGYLWLIAEGVVQHCEKKVGKPA